MVRFNPRIGMIATPNLPNVSKLEQESGRQSIVKLDYNENMFGAFPDLFKSFESVDPCQYPAFKSPALVSAIAKRHGVYGEQVYVSNGSDAIFDAIPLIFAYEPSDEVILPELTYERLSRICRINGTKIVSIPLINYELDLKMTLALITKNTKVIYLVNPNMPTGTAKSAADIGKFLEEVPSDVLVVIDQAYVEYISDDAYILDEAKLLRRHSNLLFTRTFSKYFGLASLRIGYLLASDTRIIDAFSKVCQAMPVAQYSVAAAIGALKQLPWYEKHVYQPTLQSKAEFMESLHNLNIPFVRSQGNFVYVDTRSFGWDNEDVRKFLLARHGVSIRSIRDFGLRITIGTTKQMDMVVEGFKTYLASHAVRR